MDVQSKIIRARQEDKNIDMSEFIDISEDMTISDAVWYFNTFHSKRYEIEKVFLKKFKTFQDWYEIYKQIEKRGDFYEHCLKKIEENIHSIDEALEVYNVDFSDELLRKIVFDKITHIVKENFDDWLYVYDESVFDEKLNKTALRKILTLAKSAEDYKKIYDRSEIGSEIQLKAIEKLYGMIKINEEEISQTKHIKMTQKEYMELYENEQIGSEKKDNILINKYFSADREAAGSADD
ncbi:MAG: hypothetical protein QG567_1009 [Campylobacterota bacterium]|nr:hypothetical protein [Campylobacterota bacterium]